MADIIQLLPDHVANQIAAGEVVQRPASVVKELLENAIDAGADTIKLLVKDAGKTLIQVIDNGTGMSPTDARMSLERHATSKIRNADDLFHIRTKGFRGEALASIVAVSHLEMRTRTRQDELGTRIIVEGSEVISQEPVSTPQGTSIAVKNLFFNIPARRNFLKSDKVEMRHIINEFQRVALSHPQIVFSLYHNEHEVYHLPKANLKQRIVAIFGKKTEEKWVPVSEETAIVKISGFIGKPGFSKKVRGEQFFFVNNRYVKNAYLHHAVKSAYEGLIQDAKHPSYFIYLELNPERIDINIHPTKTEIKFEDEKEIYSLLKSAVKHSLGQYQATPVLDFDKNPDLDLPYHFSQKKQATPPSVKIDRNFNPFKQGNTPAPGWESLYQDIDIPDSQEITPSVQAESSMNHLFDDNADAAVGKQHKTLSFKNKFIISTLSSGVVFIHRRRAHERILYEDFLSRLTEGKVEPQGLLFPVKIQVNTHEKRLLDSLKEDLINCGFTFEIIQDEVHISAVPPLLNEEQIPELVSELLMREDEQLPGDSFSYTDYIARILAKNAALHTGVSLHPEEDESLVNRLFLCKEPQISPFGKSVYTIIQLTEIENRL